jgi:hypothetical protein
MRSEGSGQRAQGRRAELGATRVRGGGGGSREGRWERRELLRCCAGASFAMWIRLAELFPVPLRAPRAHLGTCSLVNCPFRLGGCAWQPSRGVVSRGGAYSGPVGAPWVCWHVKSKCDIWCPS